jgi:hypothetical protein
MMVKPGSRCLMWEPPWPWTSCDERCMLTDRTPSIVYCNDQAGHDGRHWGWTITNEPPFMVSKAYWTSTDDSSVVDGQERTKSNDEPGQ